MVRLPRTQGMLAAAPIVCLVVLTAVAASAAARDTATMTKVRRPQTVVVLPTRVSSVVADGRHLAWWIHAGKGGRCELKIQIFDRATRRLTTIRPDLYCWNPVILGTALAGTRVLWGHGGPGLGDLHASVHTATVADRRPRELRGEFEIGNDSGGAIFGYPAWIAGGGGRLAYVTFFDIWHWDVWRVAGAKALRVPYPPKPLVDFAVEGRRLATANWVGRLGRDWQPSFSPDGRVEELESDGEPAWSPDGRRLAYRRDFDCSGCHELRIVNADGSGDQTLKTNGSPITPQWSPDGRTIVVGDPAYEPYLRASGIYALDPAGGKGRLLAAPTNPPTVELRDIVSGKLLRQWQVPGVSAVWLSERFLVAKTGTRCLRYELATGSKRGSSLCRGWVGLSLSGGRGVYWIGRRIFLLDLKSGRHSTLIRTGAHPIGPLIEGKRVLWAEDYRKGSRVRELVLP